MPRPPLRHLARTVPVAAVVALALAGCAGPVTAAAQPGSVDRVAPTGSAALATSGPTGSATTGSASDRTAPEASRPAAGSATISGTSVTATAPRRSGRTAKPACARMSVDGAGPYRMGIDLRVLTEAGLVDGIVRRPGVANIVDAGATGTWSGRILLVFRDNRLVDIGTATSAVCSPAGATVGMSFKQVATIYGGRGEFLTNKDGSRGYVVRFGDRVELFSDHPIRSGVGAFSVGEADYTEQHFLAGCGCR